MPRYVIERPKFSMSKSDPNTANAFKGATGLAVNLGIKWIRSYISEAEGKVYCEFEAPNREVIVEHAKKVGIPAEKISEISWEYTPGMFD